MSRLPRTNKTCSIEDCGRPVSARKMCSRHYENWRRSAPASEKSRHPDPEVRFQKATKWGEPSAHRPDLGPCLLYLGADNGNGYGQFRYNGKNGYAHRYAWERKHGPIPDGLTIDHLCRVRCCVNVEHMELTERVENYLRGVATRNTCSKGHEYTPENTYYKPSKPTARCCIICRDNTARRGQLRRTNALKGIPDNRAKFDLDVRDRLVIEVVERRLTVGQAAERLGCTYKYMDKLVGREAKARGVTSRRKHRKPILFDGWTECKTRIVVRERSNGVCERCDKARATDMHHRKNRSQSGKWHPSNIMHLCALCHVEITAEPAMSRKNGWAVPSTFNPATQPVLYRGEWAVLGEDGSVEFERKAA